MSAEPSVILPPPRVQWRLALLSILGFWSFYFVLNSISASIERGGWQFGMMERRTFVTLTGMALTWLLCLSLRRLEDRSIGSMVTVAFLGAIPVSFAYAAVNFTIFEVINPVDMGPEERSWHTMKISEPLWAVSGQAVSWYFFIAAWGILYVALAYACKVREAERRAALYRAEAQTAQLRALRYQINPHFLFNTLNSLSTLILCQRLDEAERMIMNLATFFRTSLTADPAADVPLADEVRLQRLYLDIEQTRFPDRLKVQIDLPPELEQVPVPGLILQPIVENAIKYGVARSLRPVTITIRARSLEGRLRLTVEDDGDPQPGPAGGQGHGLGLQNVRERLATRFDGAATFRYGPAASGGFSVALTLPMERVPVPVA